MLVYQRLYQNGENHILELGSQVSDDELTDSTWTRNGKETAQKIMCKML
jgi:hypothetical protein